MSNSVFAARMAAEARCSTIIIKPVTNMCEKFGKDEFCLNLQLSVPTKSNKEKKLVFHKLLINACGKHWAAPYSSDY